MCASCRPRSGLGPGGNVLDIEEFRDFLSAACENTADWRDRKATQYPSDVRNLHSAEALREVAKQLRTLPSSHPGLIRLWNLYFGPRTKAPELEREDDALRGTEIESELLRTYGFAYDQIKPDAEELLARCASGFEAEIRGR